MISARLRLAMEVIEEAADFLRTHSQMRNDISEKCENDYVTAADRKVEAMMRERIHAEFPEDSFIGEEYGSEGNGEDRWIIDPIDGTVNFMNGFPNYTISICFERGGESQFGLVSVPAQGELFSAVRGCGASLNGKMIRVSTLEDSKALCLAVPPHRQHPFLDAYMEKERKMYDIYSDVRSIGSAALSLCYVAAGRCNCYWERFLHIYDIAAGVLIAEEAGAMISLRQDGELIDVLATNPEGHEEMLALLRS